MALCSKYTWALTFENLCQAVALSGKREGGAGGLRDLDLSNNVIDIQGAYMLAGGLESNCILERLVLDHNFLTQTGARAVQMAGVRPEHVMRISMLECGISQRNEGHFDPTEPGGSYRLDLSTEYSRHVVKALVRVVLAGNGLFMPSPPLTIDGKPYTKFRVSRPKTASAQGPQSPGGGARGAGGGGQGSTAVQAALALLPQKGILEFTFGSLYKPPPIAAKLATQLHEKLLRELSNPNLTMPGIRDVLISVLHGNVLTCQQVSELLTLNNDAEYRLTVLQAVFNNISDPQHRPALLAASSPAERRRLKRLVGAACWVFTALNPTGHYNLNLNRPMQRELAIALMAFNNQENILEDEVLKQAQHRVGGPRDKALDRTWRNSKLNNKPFAFSNTRALPRNGTLVVDFVQISKPPYSKEDINVMVMPNEHLVDLVRVHGDPWHKDPACLVEQVREESNMYFFTCDMVQYLLLELTKCIVIRNMFAEKVQKVTGIQILRRWMNKAVAMCFTMWRMGIILQLKRIPSLQEAGTCLKPD